MNLSRLKRIYPLYLVGLTLGLAFSAWNFKLILGNLFFLGTLQSYIVPVPAFNSALWSLSFEMFFYLLFYVYLALNRNKLFMIGWICLSLICVPLYYLHYSGVAGHLIAVFAFSSIWLLGYFTAKYISAFPGIDIHQAFFTFGLLFLSSRIRYTSEFFA